MELVAGFVCGGGGVIYRGKHVISSKCWTGILDASSNMTTFGIQTYTIHRILQYVMLMWLYITHSLQSVKRMWRYEDLLHEEGRHRNNTRLQSVKVSFVQMGWRMWFNIKCQPVATGEVKGPVKNYDSSSGSHQYLSTFHRGGNGLLQIVIKALPIC